MRHFCRVHACGPVKHRETHLHTNTDTHTTSANKFEFSSTHFSDWTAHQRTPDGQSKWLHGLADELQVPPKICPNSGAPSGLTGWLRAWCRWGRCWWRQVVRLESKHELFSLGDKIRIQTCGCLVVIRRDAYSWCSAVPVRRKGRTRLGTVALWSKQSAHTIQHTKLPPGGGLSPRKGDTLLESEWWWCEIRCTHQCAKIGDHCKAFHSYVVHHVDKGWWYRMIETRLCRIWCIHMVNTH